MAIIMRAVCHHLSFVLGAWFAVPVFAFAVPVIDHTVFVKFSALQAGRGLITTILAGEKLMLSRATWCDKRGRNTTNTYPCTRSSRNMRERSGLIFMSVQQTYDDQHNPHGG